MTRPAHVASMIDRALQLRVGDHVFVLPPGAREMHGGVVVQVRRARRAVARVEICLRLASGVCTDWIDAASCTAVQRPESWLGDRLRIASKVCRVCQQDQPLSAYYQHPGNRDGHFHECRTCVNRIKLAREHAVREARAHANGGAQ